MADARIGEILDDPSPVVTSWSELTEEGYRMDVSIAEVLKERSENLPFRALEVSLTIGWNDGAKRKNLSLKTMKLVDRTALPVG